MGTYGNSVECGPELFLSDNEIFRVVTIREQMKIMVLHSILRLNLPLIGTKPGFAKIITNFKFSYLKIKYRQYALEVFLEGVGVT